MISINCPHLQLVLAQRDRDDNIEHLVGTMNNAFAFVQGATDAVLDKVKSHKEVVQHMAQLAIECAYFIRGYSKTRSFCMLVFLCINQQHFMIIILPSVKSYKTFHVDRRYQD